LQGHNQQVSQHVDGLVQSLGQSGQQHSQHLQQAMQETTRQMAEATQQQLTAYQQRQDTANQHLENTLNRLSTLLDNREAGLSNLTQQTQQAQEELVRVLSRGTADFDQSARTLQDSLNQTLQGFEQLRQGQSLLKDTLKDLQTLHVEVLNSTQSAGNTANQYEQTINAMMNLHKRQEEVYTILETRLGNIIQNLTDNVNKYHNETHTRLSENLTDWDKQLREASNTFGGLIRELKESTEELPEAMDAITRLMATVR
jgi:predicted  nucleic acid-binding Zn-ribbon protein